MGFLKGCLKVVGTVALGVTGAVSKGFETASNAAGFELGSELFGAAKNASINGIANMWNPSEETMDKIYDVDESISSSSQRMMANTAKRAADIAKANGDMEKYEKYMDQYEKYK